MYLLDSGKKVSQYIRNKTFWGTASMKKLPAAEKKERIISKYIALPTNP